MDDAGFLLDAVDRFPLREVFADSLEHTDPVPLVVLPRRDATPATAADSNAGSGCGRHVGGKITREERGATHAGDGSLLQQGVLNLQIGSTPRHRAEQRDYVLGVRRRTEHHVHL